MTEILTLTLKLAGLLLVAYAAIKIGTWYARNLAAWTYASIWLGALSVKALRNGALAGAVLGLAAAVLVPSPAVWQVAGLALGGALSVSFGQLLSAVVRLSANPHVSFMDVAEFAEERFLEGDYSLKLQ